MPSFGVTLYRHSFLPQDADITAAIYLKTMLQDLLVWKAVMAAFKQLLWLLKRCSEGNPDTITVLSQL